jgi:flagellar hook-associated protein 1 FlgK
VDEATYTDNGLDTLNITATQPGTAGNLITFSANMATVAVSINDAIAATATVGNLVRGTDQTTTQTLSLGTYEVGQSANQVVDRLANLSTTIINFNSAGSLPASSDTLAGYSANLVSYSATQASDSNSDYEKEKLFLEGYTQRLQSVSGVNLDEELARTVTLQTSYTASARVISVTKELFDVLMTIGK